MMYYKSLCILIFCFILACTPQKKYDLDKVTQEELKSEIAKALSIGSFFKIKEGSYFCYSNGHAYLMYKNDEDGQIVFSAIFKKANITKNEHIMVDFTGKKAQKLKHSNSNLKIKKSQFMPVSDYNYIFLEKQRSPDECPDTLLTIKGNKLLASGTKYQNELDIWLGFNPLYLNLDYTLKNGLYFENGHHMKLLLSKEQLFLIADKNTEVYERTFVHFIREDNSFLNKSFSTVQFDYQNKLDLAKKDIKIKMLKINNINAFKKIRFGQYLGKKNYWVQVLNIEELFNNPLLKYESDRAPDFFKVKTNRE